MFTWPLEFRREAQVAARVDSGDDLEAAAMEFGVSREALRSLLTGAIP